MSASAYLKCGFLALSIIPKPNRALRKLAVFVMTIGFSLALAITVRNGSSIFTFTLSKFILIIYVSNHMNHG
jgi:formate/nitrite transporter FocA (FNT family)